MRANELCYSVYCIALRDDFGYYGYNSEGVKIRLEDGSDYTKLISHLSKIHPEEFVIRIQVCYTQDPSVNLSSEKIHERIRKDRDELGINSYPSIEDRDNFYFEQVKILQCKNPLKPLDYENLFDDSKVTGVIGIEPILKGNSYEYDEIKVHSLIISKSKRDTKYRNVERMHKYHLNADMELEKLRNVYRFFKEEEIRKSLKNNSNP